MLHIRSADPELGDAIIQALPSALRGIPEARELLQSIRKPLTDMDQIRRRQELVGVLMALPEPARLIELKNKAYSILPLVEALFDFVEVEPGHSMPLWDAYHSPVYGDRVASRAEGLLRALAAERASAAELISALTAAADPHLSQVASELRQALDAVIPPQGASPNSPFLAGSFHKKLAQFGLFLEFAHFAKNDAYSQAGFDPERPAEFKQGWSFLMGKAAQVPNDSPRDHSIVVYTGGQSSGKSFELKKIMLMQALAQSFGWVPCAEGNFRLHDSMHYQDRRPQEGLGLSAQGQEMDDIQGHIPAMGKIPFFCWDEGGTATSPEDGYHWVMAVSLYVAQRGGRCFLANHNDYFSRPPAFKADVGVYSLRTVLDGRGGVDYQRVLENKPGDALSLDVARNTGFPEHLVRIARHYMEGRATPLPPSPAAVYRPIQTHTEQERGVLKARSLVPSKWFQEAPEDERVFRTFNESENLIYGGRSGVHLSIDEPPVQPLTRMTYDSALWKRHNLHVWTFKGAPPEGREASERQRTFAALAGSELLSPGAYEDYLKTEELLLHLIPLFYSVTERAGSFLSFNRDINPFRNRSVPPPTIEQKGVFLTYLELNRKLMGGAFPLENEYRELKALGAAYRSLQETLLDLDLDDIVAREREQGGLANGLAGRQASLRKKWDQLLRQFPEAPAAGWEKKRTLRRFLAMGEGLAKQERENPNTRGLVAAQETLNGLIETFRAAVETLALPGPNGIQRSLYDIGDELESKMALASRLTESLPPKNLFEADLDSIREELTAVARFNVGRVRNWDELRRGMEFYGNELFSFALLFSCAKTDIAADFLARVRAVDSVHLHQMANSLEERINTLFSDEASETRVPLASGPALFKILSDAYRDSIKPLAGVLSQPMPEDNSEYREKHWHRPYQRAVQQALPIRKIHVPYYEEDPQEQLKQDILAVGSVLMIGRMIRDQGQASVNRNQTGEIKLENFWNPLHSKTIQIANDAVWQGGELVKMLGSANMSGKTMLMEGLHVGLAWAAQTNFATAREASLPFIDLSVFVDRINSRSDPNLGMFANEIKQWIKFLDALPTAGQKTAICFLDEIFSTAPPLYQAALTYAVCWEILSRGQKVVIASHNHGVIDRLTRDFPGQIHAYHFTWRKEGKKFVREFKLRPGRDQSHAYEIALMMGLNQKILRIWENIRKSG